jgi:hypothetical protein
LATGLSDRQIYTLADYYSQQRLPWPAREKIDSVLRGRELVGAGNLVRRGASVSELPRPGFLRPARPS